MLDREIAVLELEKLDVLEVPDWEVDELSTGISVRVSQQWAKYTVPVESPTKGA